jgi:hypothetical protein
VNYADWTAAFVAQHNGFVRGLCSEATTKMVVAFPELRRACGFATWVANRVVRDQHWWCVAPDGMIVDPTRAQFGGQPVDYEEINLDDPNDRARIPTGRCMNCSGDVFGGATFCSDACEANTMTDMGCTRTADGGWQS